jgi:hypothetical protein
MIIIMKGWGGGTQEGGGAGVSVVHKQEIVCLLSSTFTVLFVFEKFQVSGSKKTTFVAGFVVPLSPLRQILLKLLKLAR